MKTRCVIAGLGLLALSTACGGRAHFAPPDAGTAGGGEDARAEGGQDEHDAGRDYFAESCGGTETLEVEVVTDAHADYAGPAVPAPGAFLWLDCGDGIVITPDADAEGRHVFEGLAAGRTFDVTADFWGYRTTLLGARAGTGEPLRITVRQLGWGGRVLAGRAARLSDESTLVLSAENGGYGESTEADFSFVAPPAVGRVTALEVLVGANGAEPLGLGSIDAPALESFEELEVVVTPGPFEAAEVDLLVEDPRLDGASEDHLRSAVRVLDVAEERLGGNVVGVTTAAEVTAVGLHAAVAWWPDFVRDPRTELRASSADLAVLSLVVGRGTPAELGVVEMPAPPELAWPDPGGPVDLARDVLSVRWPAWSEMRFVEVGWSLPARGIPFFPTWTFVVLDDRPQVDLRSYAPGSAALLAAPPGAVPRMSLAARDHWPGPIYRLAQDARAELVVR